MILLKREHSFNLSWTLFRKLTSKFEAYVCSILTNGIERFLAFGNAKDFHWRIWGQPLIHTTALGQDQKFSSSVASLQVLTPMNCIFALAYEASNLELAILVARFDKVLPVLVYRSFIVSGHFSLILDASENGTRRGR